MSAWILALVVTAWAQPTREQIEPYRCRFRDGQDMREILAHGNVITEANLDDLHLTGPMERVTGFNLPMFDVLRLFAEASGLDVTLSPDVARLSVTLRYDGDATVRGFADRLWAVFKQKNLLVIDDGFYLRVMAPCRYQVQDF